MPNSFLRSLNLIVAAAAFITACSKADSSKTVSLDKSAAGAATGGQLPAGHPDIAPSAAVPPAAKIYLDSGNAAYRAKTYDAALRYYDKAAKLAPDHGAPWFGIYMVGEVTKNRKLADSALAEVKKRTPQDGAPAAPGDSALRNPHATTLPKS